MNAYTRYWNLHNNYRNLRMLVYLILLLAIILPQQEFVSLAVGYSVSDMFFTYIKPWIKNRRKPIEE